MKKKSGSTIGKLHTNTRTGCSGVAESVIEEHLTAAVNAFGGMCLKFVTPGYTGVPDRIILLPGGQVVFAETKRPGGKERRRQELVQSRLRAFGFTVFSTVDSDEKIDAIIKHCWEAMISDSLGSR